MTKKAHPTLLKRSELDGVQLLYENLITGLVVNTAAAAALAFGFMANAQLFEKKIWFLGMMVVVVARLLDLFYSQRESNTVNAKSMLNRFRIGAYATGVMWSVYNVYFFESMSLVEFATTVVIMASLAGGASAILAADRTLAMSYSGLILIPLSIRGFLSEESHHNILAILGVVFTVVMALTGRKTSAFTKSAIITKNHNHDLVEEQNVLLTKMEEQNQEIVQINQSLERKVEHRTQDIFRLSNVDPLTELSNRTAFSKNLSAQISSALCHSSPMNIAVLFIDLDGFKAVNDAHGHVVGDKVLQLSSKRLNEAAGSENLLCRWGGDEFIIAIQNASSEQALVAANNVISALSEAIVLAHHELQVGATIGIAMFPEHSQEVDELILLADTAMYEQKQKSKSRALLFSASMRASLIREQQLSEGLGQAMAKHELYLVYQPVIDAANNSTAYCEALVRWDFSGETISPAEFIVIAEHHAYIHKIGCWVLHQACMQAANWHFEPDVGVSVNVSIIQIMHKDIVQEVKSALAISGLQAQNLFLEITESIFAADVQQVISVVKELKGLGVQVSIDDFGTGFSSLSVLQNLSADVVKIDKAFVSSFDTGGKAIIQATQYMASELDYDVTVEGVETAEQWQALVAMDVKYLQGFYFAKPMRPSELKAWHASFVSQFALPS